MHSALIRKEMVQCGGFCIIALIACAALPYWFYDENRSLAVPFIGGTYVQFVGWVNGSDVLSGNFNFIGGVLASVIGLTQSAGESISGMWHFLLYRPISPRRVLAVKLLSGLCLLMTCTAIPSLAYGIWASTPGTHYSPFEWWMTERFWQQWLTLPVIYLAAFQSGLLDARWYGVRLLPVVAAGAFCFLMITVPYWWIVGLPIVTAVMSCQLVTLFHTMHVRDFS